MESLRSAAKFNSSAKERIFSNARSKKKKHKPESSISQAEAANVMEGFDKKILKPSIQKMQKIYKSYLLLEPAATRRNGSEEDEESSISQAEAATIMEGFDKKILKPLNLQVKQGHADISEPILELNPNLSPLFEKLPECLLTEIFSQVLHTAQMRLQVVCRTWDRLIATLEPMDPILCHLPNGALSYLFLEPAATLRNGSEEDGVHPHTTPRRSPFSPESESG
ncbi:hypothetical protein RHGRI_013451 [Rhododendron griersonianum]|uniref:F-box domain-containing protein n=1 Tax=Rhododendron griersonianum TaxID=479676 RepID=A0AAV6K5V6_9ERIC|nr:hypothetical protein RHGRI_013451 [Rhododendron griersonianum]